MNEFKERNRVNLLDTYYIQPNRTINVMLIEDIEEGCQRAVYVYNCDGLYYRLFFDLHALMGFFYEDEETIEFECEKDADMERYLESMEWKRRPKRRMK